MRLTFVKKIPRFAISLTILLFVFIMDLNTPLGMADGVGYILALLLLIKAGERKTFFLISSLALILIMAGYFFSPPMQLSPAISINNRLMSSVIIVVVTIAFSQNMTLQKEITKSNENYLTIYENDLVPVITIDMNSERVLRVNDAAVRLFGYRSKKHFLDTYDPLLHFVNGFDSFDIQNLKDAVEEKTYEMKKKDGTRFWIQQLTKIDSSKSTAVTLLVDITKTVTIQEKLHIKQQKLRIKLEELENANNELESFNYVTGHDLQEPLRKIKNFASYFKDTERSNFSPEAEYSLHKLTEMVQLMQTRLQNFLSFSLLRKAQQNFEIVDLNSVFEEAINSFYDEINERRVAIKAEQMCIITGVKFQLIQLFTNLLSNSLKFSHPERTVEIVISCSLISGKHIGFGLHEENEKFCRLTVADNGIGFDPQYNERIFRIFERLEKEKYPGTGIGLAICKRVVENHHGLIKASGQLNVGAQFDIYLPLTHNHDRFK